MPGAIAKKAIAEHEKGNPFQIGMFTGASTGDKLDGELARANAIKFRTPYQSNKDLRALLNSHGAQYYDMHLSELAQSLRYGFLGKIDVAIVEAADVTEDGEIVPTSGVGILPTICRMADRIIIELNCRHPKEIRGMHDIYEPADPPYRREIPIYTPSDRIGSDCVKVDPAKIVGVVKTDEPNEGGKFSPLDDVTMAIGQNVANFLVGEIKAGRLPKEFVPLQSGVGNVANAVLGCMGENKDIPAFNVYTEVIQDAVIALMKEGRVKFASGCSLSVSNEVIRDIYANLDFFKDKILLRPQEISNNPEVARRLGLVAINTALEADIFGNINSTHVSGTRMMNGIGGSGDFTRSAMLSIFTTPSTCPCFMTFGPCVGPCCCMRTVCDGWSRIRRAACALPAWTTPAMTAGVNAICRKPCVWPPRWRTAPGLSASCAYPTTRTTPPGILPRAGGAMCAFPISRSAGADWAAACSFFGVGKRMCPAA